MNERVGVNGHAKRMKQIFESLQSGFTKNKKKKGIYIKVSNFKIVMLSFFLFVLFFFCPGKPWL